MAIQLRSPSLPKISLFLAITSVVLLPFGFIVSTAGTLAGLAWRPAALLAAAVGAIAWFSAPVFAIAAIVTGHLSQRRHPGEGLGRVGLIVGYAALGFLIVVGSLAVVTWWTINTRYSR